MARCILLCLLAATTMAWCGGEVSLDGEWQLCRAATAAKPGADATWEPIRVPSFVNQAKGLPFLWYRRTFHVAEEKERPHLFLRFGGAKFVTTVFVNGQEAGGHVGGFEPFEVDVTKLVRRDRPNDLLVRVQDVTGVIDAPTDHDKVPRGGRFIEQVQDAILHPIGSQSSRVGLWQSVSLIARPDVTIEDVWVRTSVRKKQIEADVTVRNLGATPVQTDVTAQVEGADVSLGTAKARVPAKGTATVALKCAWAKPRLWTPEDPHLYRLSAEVRQGEAVLHARVIRFGFREFWTDGPHFVLNGTRMKFLATAGHPRGNLDKGLSKQDAIDFYKRIREAGCVAMRLHANVWPEAWYEAADEVGMPLIMESALFCYARNYALNKPAFWANYHKHLEAIIRHKRNHPSIVMTSLENEILHCGGERYAKDCEHRLAEAGRFVKQLDPTRPIMFDGDGDPEGVADVINLHYPLDFDKQNLWPNCAYWVDKGMKVAAWPRKFWKWDRKKPLYFGEFLHLQHYREADNYTTLLGDAAYVGHDRAMAMCKALAWEMQIKAYRAQDVSGLCPWTLTETGTLASDDNPRYMAVKRAYAPIAAFIREMDTRFYAGEALRRTVDIYNDTLHPAELTLVWELKDEGDDLAIQTGRRDFDLQPAQHVPFTLVFRDRELMDEGPHHLSLALSLRKGDKVVFAERHRYALRARAKREWAVDEPTGRRVALYEGPQRKLRQVLRSAGARVEIVRDLRKLPDAGVLVIGPHALDGLAPSEGVPTVGPSGTARDGLSAFVRNGGAVLVLEQNSYDCGPLPARLVDRACSVGFLRNTHWTLFCELRRDDLRFWRGDHVVARKTIAKPTHGRFRVLSDSGGPAGLSYLPALEVLDGKGSYVLSQFLIGEKLGKEPAAQLVLEGLLRYSVIPYGSDRRPETSTLGIIQNALALGTALDEVDAIFIDLSGKLGATDLSPFRVLLAEADALEVTQHLAKLREFVEDGGTLVLHAGTRAGIARLQRLFPEKIVAQPNTSVPVNINRAERHDLVIAGLTNQELYWYGDRDGLHWRVRTPLSAEVCDHVILGGLPDPKTCQTLEAEKMAEVHGTPSVREREVYMHRNAAIKTAVDVPKDGEYALIVRGRGTQVAATYPQIAIDVDGKRVGSLTTAGEEWGEYFLTTKVAKGKHEVTLAFVNDAWDPVKNEDRNVSLDWLRIGPVRPMKAKRLLNPPALVKMPLGKGTILLDQVRWDKRPGDVKASRYLSNILTNLNCDFHSPMGGVTIAGGDMTPAKGAKLWQAKGGIASLGTNGTLSTRVRFAKAGKVAFAIRAEGTQALGEWPNIAVAIDGKKLGDVMLRRAGWHTVRLEAAVAEGEHEVALSFTNDYYDDTQEPKIDRNLRIGELRIR